MHRRAVVITVAFISMSVVGAVAIAAPNFLRASWPSDHVAALEERLFQAEHVLTVERPIIAMATGERITSLRLILAPSVAPEYVALMVSDEGLGVSYASGLNRPTPLGWSANWLNGTGPFLDSGERVELVLTVPSHVSIGPNDSFSLNVENDVGPPLVLHLRLPAELASVNGLWP